MSKVSSIVDKDYFYIHFSGCETINTSKIYLKKYIFLKFIFIYLLNKNVLEQIEI